MPYGKQAFGPEGFPDVQRQVRKHEYPVLSFEQAYQDEADEFLRAGEQEKRNATEGVQQGRKQGTSSDEEKVRQ